MGLIKGTPMIYKIKNHMDDCFTYGAQKTNMPEEGKNIIEFKDIAKQQKLPFCIYADTECLLTNRGAKTSRTCEPSSQKIFGDVLPHRIFLPKLTLFCRKFVNFSSKKQKENI